MAPSGGGTGTGDWKTDGQHYSRCPVHLPVPAAVRGTTEGECGLISKHIHRQLVRCNPLFHILNVLVPTGFVLVGKKNNTLRRVLQSLDRVIICLTVLLSSVLVFSGGSRGGRLGQLPRAPREGGTKEGRAKITWICMTKNVIDFMILNNQMFRINDIDIYNINQYSIALHWLQSLCELKSHYSSELLPDQPRWLQFYFACFCLCKLFTVVNWLCSIQQLHWICCFWVLNQNCWKPILQCTDWLFIY